MEFLADGHECHPGIEIYLGVIGAQDERDALRRAQLLVPEAKPGELVVRPWQGESA